MLAGDFHTDHGLTVQVGDLPARDRFGFWWDTVARSVVSVDAFSEHAADFWGEMRLVDLGLVQVSHVRCAAFEARRTPRRIRGSDPGLLQLSLSLAGRSGLHQERREADLGPGDLVLYDTSRTFHAWTGATGPARSLAEGIIMQFPRSALPLPESVIDGLLAVRRPGRAGTGALLLALLRELTRQRAPLSPHKIFQRLGLSVADWIRYRRLERCRRDLSDPAQAATPVGVIARRWGFTNDSTSAAPSKPPTESPRAAYRRALRVR
ncbi:hypothetical protein Acor_23140 [Acrocarpospora corrugata]|uniref:HTH araC/xylS-type domain-containing protein n=1 Tax=Acrocarpospora corrugata TaxID=35763 RepID=A0A5M3VZI3_9ACTN|nr:helix-turn-helix domain-containing protein [Acrocarpospora corrugata]GES00251.1 hypothetical protein Acor_23140 [Acrocarpospora corrugata]